MKIYVGNLSYEMDEDGLREEFSQYGDIEDVKLIKDYETGRSKGFGFITFTSEDAMTASLEKNGQEIGGRAIRVNKAEERKPGGGGARRDNAGGGGGNRGGGFGGGNRRY